MLLANGCSNLGCKVIKVQVCIFPLWGVNYAGLKALGLLLGWESENLAAINMAFNKALQVQNGRNVKAHKSHQNVTF